MMFNDIKLEVGKFYKLDNGNKLKIIHLRENNVPCKIIGIEYVGDQEILHSKDKLQIVDYWREKVIINMWVGIFENGYVSKAYNSVADLESDFKYKGYSYQKIVKLTGEYTKDV